MVHARPFSFYDDAASVSLPSSFSSGPSVAKPAALDASVPLFRLRQLQSSWYQTLFQSDPTDPLPNALSFIWQKCFEMREWSEGLPDDMTTGIREMLNLELRYSYVYCIAPSARAPDLTAYGRMLIFEHAIAYVDRLYEVANSTTRTAFYTYHDALRLYFMGSQFVAVLRDAGDLVLSGSPIPAPHFVPGKAPPPPLPVRIDRGGGDKLERSLRCLEKVKLTLKLYGDRWEDALSFLQSFEMMSAEVLKSLETRRVMREAVAATRGVEHASPPNQQRHQLPVPQPVPNAMPNPEHHSPLAQHQHQLQPPPPQQGPEVRWMDVDVARMIHGGGHI